MTRHTRTTRYALAVRRLALSLLLLTALLSATVSAARADVVKTFTLTNVTFSDGSVAEGTFTYDFTTQTLVSVRITSGNAVYDNSAAPVSVTTSGFSGAFDSPTESDTFQFSLKTPLTPTSGSAITLDPSLSTETIDTTPGGDGGSVTTLPVASGSVLASASLPATTASFAGTAGKNGWYTTAVTVTLTAKAGALPIAKTEYGLDGAAPQPYTGPFAISTESAHTLTFRSTDTGGNVEAIETLPVNVDGTPPVTYGTQYNGKTLTYVASDAVSGVAATYYTLDGGAVKTASGGTITVLGYGPHPFNLWSVDVAGNVETPAASSLDVPPSIPGQPSLAAQTATSVTLTWAASHSAVPVAGYYLRRYFPGHGGRGGGPGRWNTVATTATNSITYSVTAVGNVEFAVESFDSSGYPSGQSLPVYVRAYSPPTITSDAEFNPTYGPYAVLGGGFGELVGGTSTGFTPFLVTASAYPAPTLKVTSGPKGMTVNSKTGLVSWTPVGAPGTYAATITATNVAGSASLTFPYVVYAAGTDLFAPTAPASAPTFSGITHTAVTVSWPASVDNVGVAGYELDFNNFSIPSQVIVKSAGTARSLLVSTLPPGSTWAVTVYAYDAAGHSSAGSPVGDLSLAP